MILRIISKNTHMFKKIAFGTLGLALLATPLVTSADAISDLRAQIQGTYRTARANATTGKSFV